MAAALVQTEEVSPIMEKCVNCSKQPHFRRMFKKPENKRDDRNTVDN